MGIKKAYTKKHIYKQDYTDLINFLKQYDDENTKKTSSSDYKTSKGSNS